MSISPQAGFEWPARTNLTNPFNVTITVSPYAANFGGIEAANGGRTGELHRSYATDHGLDNENDIKTSLAGAGRPPRS